MLVLRNSETKDVVSKPFAATKGYKTPEGYTADWAETLLGAAATALAAKRIKNHQPKGVSDKQLAWAVVSGARIALDLNRLSEEAGKARTSQLYSVTFNAFKEGEKINARYSFALNGAHWHFAYRIFKLAAGVLKIDVSSEEILTKERKDAKLAALIQGGVVDDSPAQ